MATLMGQKKFLSPFILKMTMNDILRRRKKSHSALVYNAASYVARKAIAKNACPSCAGHLCVSRSGASADVGARYNGPAYNRLSDIMDHIQTEVWSAYFINATKFVCNGPRYNRLSATVDEFSVNFRQNCSYRTDFCSVNTD